MSDDRYAKIWKAIHRYHHTLTHKRGAKALWGARDAILYAIYDLELNTEWRRVARMYYLDHEGFSSRCECAACQAARRL